VVTLRRRLGPKVVAADIPPGDGLGRRSSVPYI
jgi:hypothetical protein